MDACAALTPESLHKVYVNSKQIFFVDEADPAESPQVARKAGDPIASRLRLRIDGLRRQMDMQWSDVVRASGQLQQDVSRFSTGQMKYPPLTFLDSLARVFHLTLADLLADELPEPSLTAQERRVLAHWKSLGTVQAAAFESLIHPKKKNR